ncbi:MAG TPA: alpha/beta hydrolase [Magnetospirillaceae bacterium]
MRIAASIAALCIASIATAAWAANKAEKEEKEGAASNVSDVFHDPPPNEIGVRLPTRSGVTEPFMFDLPANPKAVVILFPGGEGAIDIVGEGPSAKVKRWGNFLIRTRAKFVAAGLATIALDVPSDHSDGIDEGFRKGEEHAADVSAVIAWVRQKTKAPVWLVGTSMGTISAASVAIRLGKDIDGVVLTSTVTAGGRNSPGLGVSTLDVDKITVPALVMDHDNESCKVSPSSNEDIVAKRMTKSPRVAVKMISGGDPPRSGPCDAFSAHGYFGAEDKAVGTIAAFITQ